jgi:hypothetical protein
MKTYEILQLQNFIDPGGYEKLQLRGSKLQYLDQEWSYLASGLSRDVFRSECGTKVLKIPQRVWKTDNTEWELSLNDQWEYDHNRLEFQVYDESPEWCKKHIAKTELTDEHLVIQEYVDVHYIGDAYWREIGYREDGTTVIFDCDIFLDFSMKKPNSGFKYEEVFGHKNIFPECYQTIEHNKKERRKKEKENIAKYFPGILDGTQIFSSQSGYGGQKVWIKNLISRDENGRGTFDDGVEISLELALECGFITEIYKD